jgi:hypothetical protein
VERLFVSQSLAGYEDANDAGLLRHDPIFQLLGEAAPGQVLSSHDTNPSLKPLILSYSAGTILSIGSAAHLRAHTYDEQCPQDEPTDVGPPGDSTLIGHPQRRNTAEKLQEEPVTQH